MSFTASSHESARPAKSNIWAPSAKTTSLKSEGPSPFKVSTASITSMAFPTAFPSGWSISVMTAAVFLPAIVPIDTISFASATESSYFFMNAPFPVLTSSTIASLPEANFLLIIELAISDI